jgi:hypothetical protein
MSRNQRADAAGSEPMPLVAGRELVCIVALASAFAGL